MLRATSPELSDALQTGTLALESLRGAGNLSYRLTQLRDALCSAYCFLDDDQAARDAFEKAQELSLITLGDITLATCPGRAEAELEDLYDPAVYAHVLQGRYGISLVGPKFRNAKKWSVRMRDTFKQHGKPWTDKIEAEVKDLVATAVAKAPETALNVATRSCFDSLVAVLRERVAAIRHSVRRSPPNKALKLAGATAPAA